MWLFCPAATLAETWTADNPGSDHVRMALVATHQETLEAAERIAHFMRRG